MYSLHSWIPLFSPFPLPIIYPSVLVCHSSSRPAQVRAPSWGNSWRGPEVVVLFVHSAGWICGLSTVYSSFWPVSQILLLPQCQTQSPQTWRQWLHAPLQKTQLRLRYTGGCSTGQGGGVEILWDGVKFFELRYDYVI